MFSSSVVGTGRHISEKDKNEEQVPIKKQSPTPPSVGNKLILVRKQTFVESL
jgi:hypothetical protein